MRFLILPLLFALALPAIAFPVERCINLSNFLEAPRGEVWGPEITAAHLDTIRAAGFDTVRLPVRFSDGWDGRIDPWRLTQADALVRSALERGLRVIVVVHHYREIMTNPTTHGPRLTAIWAELSAHWRDMPDGVIFELLNEPEPPLDTAAAVALFDQLVPVIRVHHPDRWLIIEGGNWASRTELTALPAYDARTVRSFHYYEPHALTHQLAPWHFPPLPPIPWDATRGTEVIARHFDQARAAADGPLFLGEFGVYRLANASVRRGWIRSVRHAAEARGIAWCVWGFAAEFRTYDTDAEAWIAPQIEALMGD